ncbi:prophage tail fiber N-terminal domain-containing protein, partial [Escherichia coli]|nr:prophage tail fiber N-terminal domain-containing protein [Escherichia coli]
MAVKISGVLKDGTGKPVQNCTIQLKAKRNSTTVVVNTLASENPDEAGRYSMDVEYGQYSVILLVEGFPPSHAGTITVYEDSQSGTLNDFLTAIDEGDLKPDVVKRFEEMVAQAQQSAEAAAESERQAGQHAADAQKIKEGCQALANDVQKNAGAVAEDKRQVENLASRVENTAAEVKKDAEAAKQAASDAEQARDDIDVALSSTLKTANRLSEIAAEGEEAQQASRDHLGLKSAATMEPQSDIHDRTEGCLAIPGAFGFGHIFTSSELIRFKTEADFLEWVRNATPGEYCVAEANSMSSILPGVVFMGIISIRFLEADRVPQDPWYAKKAIIFYGVNGEIYYNRYGAYGGAWLAGWEKLKLSEKGIADTLRSVGG